MTRSPNADLCLDLALWRANHQILGAHQRGARYLGEGLRKENIGGEVKQEDEGVIGRTSDREYARFSFLGGLKEVARIAPTTMEAVVAVANRNTPGPGLDKALLVDMGVPKDSVEKVMQVYLSCYGNILTRDDGKDESHHQIHRNRRDKEGELKHASSRRDSDGKGHRRSNGERVNRTSNFIFNYLLRRIRGDIGNQGRLTGM